jgi:hypothetical protein
MRWLTIALALLVLAGCSDSHDSTPTETTVSDSDAPSAYRALMAQLPPLDEPASDEVTRYRIAVLEAESAGCAPGKGGAPRPAFVRANAEVLALAGTVRGARLVSARAVPHGDGNGCPAGSGPPTYFTTERVYRLPAGTSADAVFARYERVLHYGWLETTGTRPCERQFAQAAAYLTVEPCGGILRLAALGLAPVALARDAQLPPRPFGLQYPASADQASQAGPTPDEAESGETCERAAGRDVPSIIVPPPPGVTAAWRERRIVVDWSFAHVQGDCPPRRVLLSVESPDPGSAPYVRRVAVHEHAGTAELSVPGSFEDATVLRAATESVDGTRSRSVAVVIRRQS